MQATNNPKFICPLHVGECNGGNLSKFIDFNPSLYPDSITAIADTAPSKPETAVVAPPKAPVANDTGTAVEEEEEVGGDEPENEITCQVCYEHLTLLPAGTWNDGWRCDWPGHEGENCFTTHDRLYGCPTVHECNWGVCQTCWDTYHNDKTGEVEDPKESLNVPQPQGTKSVYNADYYCEVKQVRFEQYDDDHVRFVVEYNARGDMSLGKLQDPKTSYLECNGVRIPTSDVNTYFSDKYQNRGELVYLLTEDTVTDLLQHKVQFFFGVDGYSGATLILPNSEYKVVEMPYCPIGHVMTISDYAEGDYASGFCCDLCRAGKFGFRWFCEHCSSDKCFSCEPLRAMFPKCGMNEDHELVRSSGLQYGSRNCDKCKRSRIQGDPEYYHCIEDGYDLCLKCASEQQLAINEASDV
jgi:hypothetical protein